MVNAALISDPTNMVPKDSIVTETIIGRRSPFLAKTSSIPFKAALICRTSWQVSTMNKSTPPSNNPSACSANA